MSLELVAKNMKNNEEMEGKLPENPIPIERRIEKYLKEREKFDDDIEQFTVENILQSSYDQPPGDYLTPAQKFLMEGIKVTQKPIQSISCENVQDFLLKQAVFQPFTEASYKIQNTERLEEMIQGTFTEVRKTLSRKSITRGDSKAIISLSNKTSTLFTDSGDSTTDVSMRNSAFVLMRELSKTSVTNADSQTQEILRLKKIVNELTEENDNLKRKIENMKCEIDGFGPRYKYLEQNFEDFVKMKDEYLKLKMEKVKELLKSGSVDRAMQTWDTTIVCDQCVKTLQLLSNPQLKNLISLSKTDGYIVQKDNLLDLQNQYKELKKFVIERERDYENRTEKAEIIALTASNIGYRNRIIELEARCKQTLSWTNSLQEVIAKLFHGKGSISNLTTKQTKWVEKISEKFANSKTPEKEQEEGGEGVDS